MDPHIIQEIETWLCTHLECDARITKIDPCTGGDTSESFRLNVCSGRGDHEFFAKHHPYCEHKMLAAELHNLRSMATHLSGHLPKAYNLVSDSLSSVLLLEYLPLQPVHSNTEQQLAAELVAKCHSIKSDYFGWPKSNFIGRAEQTNLTTINSTTHSWADFWITQRLEPQWRKALTSDLKGKLKTIEQSLFKKVYDILSLQCIDPVLVHGDLWSGNIGIANNKSSNSSRAFLFDPACYFGDAETDIAMTLLFGGFSHVFYEHYFDRFPKKPNFEIKIPIYQLYHLLNHLNIFGISYAKSVLGTCEKITKNG